MAVPTGDWFCDDHQKKMTSSRSPKTSRASKTSAPSSGVGGSSGRKRSSSATSVGSVSPSFRSKGSANKKGPKPSTGGSAAGGKAAGKATGKAKAIGGGTRRPSGRAPDGKTWDHVSGKWVLRPTGRAPDGKTWDPVSGKWVLPCGCARRNSKTHRFDSATGQRSCEGGAGKGGDGKFRGVMTLCDCGQGTPGHKNSTAKNGCAYYGTALENESVVQRFGTHNAFVRVGADTEPCDALAKVSRYVSKLAPRKE